MTRRTAIAGAGLVLGGAFYLLFIDTTDLPELYVLCGVALLAALAFEISREQAFPEVAIKLRWLARGWRVLVSVPKHIGLVSQEALVQLFTLKRTRGAFRVVPFTSDDDPMSRGRVALSETLGSFAPNTIVVGVDPETNLLLTHQLRREGGRDELDVMRLG
jgi:hypothetical protein